MARLLTEPRMAVMVGQVALGVCLLICVAIDPHYVFSLDQGGVSNYATADLTRPIFTVGLLAAAAGCFVGARQLNDRRWIQLTLRVLGVLYLAVLVTSFTYKLDGAYRTAHEVAAITLFLFMLVTVCGLAVAGISRRERLWFSLFLAGFAGATLTYFGYLHILFTSQSACGIAFAVLIVRASKNPDSPRAAGSLQH